MIDKKAKKIDWELHKYEITACLELLCANQSPTVVDKMVKCIESLIDDLKKQANE